MKCVYSFWSRPFLKNLANNARNNSDTEIHANYLLNSYAGFSSFEDFLNSWILSVELSSKHYQEIELVTDTYGKSLLVDKLNLPFTSVITQLDNIPEHVSSRHWALSKVVAYTIQHEPFVHVDADVYLWKRLPKEIEEAPVFGQNTESEVWSNAHYAEPYFLMYKYLKILPDDFTFEPIKFHQWDTAITCGIVGGQDWELIKYVGDKGVEVLCCLDNTDGWNAALNYDYLWGDRAPSHGYISVIEQYGIAKECWSRGIWNEVRFLLDEKTISKDINFLKRECFKLGYTHLIGQTKKSLDVMNRLRKRVALNYPQYIPVVSNLIQNPSSCSTIIESNSFNSSKVRLASTDVKSGFNYLNHALKHYELSRKDQKEIQVFANDVICCVVVRNESLRLPFFLNYYRQQGIKSFFIVDNNSDDNTLDYLLQQSDVYTWHSTFSFSQANFGSAWIELLLRMYGLGHWCLIVDADELFYYPDCEHKKIPQLCQELDVTNKRAYNALLLDMYSEKSLKDTHYASGQSYLEVCSYFDRNFYHEKHEEAGPFYNQTLYIGGVRERVFGPTQDYYYLSKVPLIKYDTDCVLAGGQHWTNIPIEKISSGRGCLLHFKFFSTFLDYVNQEMKRQEHCDQAKEYKQYYQVISENKAFSIYDPQISVKLHNSQQLIDLGVMKV